MLLSDRFKSNIKYHLIYSVILLLILFGALPLFQTVFSVLFRGNVVLYVIVGTLLVGFYYALPERIRLDHDGEQMREFRTAHPDGTYDWVADIGEVLRSPEFFTDVVSIIGAVAAATAIVFLAFLLRIISPPALLKAMATNPAVLFLIAPASVVLAFVYGLFHLWFTVSVRRGWDASRLHVARERHMDYSDQKKK